MTHHTLSSVYLLLLYVLLNSPLSAQTEGEYAKWESTQEGMIFLAGGDEVTVDGIRFINTGQVYRDSYGRIENLQNSYDLTAKRGPIFKEAKIIDGIRKERYFVFIAQNLGDDKRSVRKRYLDLVASSMKERLETLKRQSTTQGGESTSDMVSGVTVPAIVWVVGILAVLLLVFLLLRIRVRKPPSETEGSP